MTDKNINDLKINAELRFISIKKLQDDPTRYCTNISPNSIYYQDSMNPDSIEYPDSMNPDSFYYNFL